MSTPEAQRKARKDYRDRQKAAGAKVSAFMLSPEALQALDKLVGPKVSKNAAVNAALIESARRLGDADDDRELPPLTNAELKAIVAAMPVGRPAEPAPKAQARQTPAKPGKAVREAPVRTAGPKLDIPVGPQPFQPRLKGGKK